jgi:putative transposase
MVPAQHAGGEMRLQRVARCLSQVFAGQNVGIKEIAEKIWLVSFMNYDFGFFDHETGRVECAPNPFGAKVLPMCPV